jgi:hypothetical protein
MSGDRPPFSWQVLDRDSGFADQVRRQPHVPRGGLIAYSGVTRLVTKSVYYLVWAAFRTGGAKTKGIHISVRFASEDMQQIAGIGFIMHLSAIM